jgi:hypothetical protein
MVANKSADSWLVHDNSIFHALQRFFNRHPRENGNRGKRADV